MMRADISNYLFHLGSIDIFYANAGYPYYEIIDYTDWESPAEPSA